MNRLLSNIKVNCYHTLVVVINVVQIGPPRGLLWKVALFAVVDIFTGKKISITCSVVVLLFWAGS
tara:strand:- start:367 stop:561 length:195 start_codon:yes stop_codon:yes gene_type:complete